MSPSSPLICSGSGDELDQVWGVDVAKGERLPLVLVPTTAGTGSEATPISVITCEGGVKLAVNARPLTADWALLDPGLTIGLPCHVTAATGIDAMVHAIEAYTSARLKNPISDALAREALKLLSANLLTACRQPDNLKARSAMLLGAHLAGIAFSNAPVGGVHALAYPLGGLFHLPHGLTNALMLRPVLEHNSEAARELYAELAPILDSGLESQGSQARAQGFINQVCRLPPTPGSACACATMALARTRSASWQRGDEANPAAGEQSLPDRGGGRAAAVRGRLVSREEPRPRSAYKVWRTIPTRWADNDSYGHVNNVVFYPGSTRR